MFLVDRAFARAFAFFFSPTAGNDAVRWKPSSSWEKHERRRRQPDGRLLDALCDMDGGSRATILAAISGYDRLRADRLYAAVCDDMLVETGLKESPK